jgi:NAD(P)H-flavin reductase
MVGDTLKIGAPMGDLAIDKNSQRDVLCVAGGTGLAPIKALVDEMTRWNTARKVTIFFGVRRASDLYDMGSLHRMAAINPWIKIIPCVSEEPNFNGEKGNLPDIIARHGSWTDHDVIICGSPDMSRATLVKLRELGVPSDRVSFDVAGDLHPAVADREVGAQAQVIDLRARAQANRGQLPRR